MKKYLLICSLVLSLAILFGCFGIFHVKANSASPSLAIELCNLSFKDTVYVKYAVAATGTADVSLLIWTEPQTSYTVGTEAVRLTESYSNTIGGKSYRVFDYKGLTAKQMTDDLYACAYTRVDGVDYYSSVNKYSVLQYAMNKLGKTGTATTDEKLKTLLREMLDYGAAAQVEMNYKANRPANGDFYSIEVVGGTLPDGFTRGLYLATETVTLNAPATNSGKSFSYWKTSAGGNAGTGSTQTVTVGNKNETYTAVYGATTIPALAKPEPFVVKGTYMPHDVSAYIKTLYAAEASKVGAIWISNGPYMPLNTSSLSGTKLTSISLAVVNVGATDANGDFTLTLAVVGNDIESIKTTRRTYSVKVNAAEYGLTENTSPRTWLKIDLTPYNIVLAEDETVAYSAPTDTITPGGINDKNTMLGKQLAELFPQGGGYCRYVGTSKVEYYDTLDLLVDFEFERSYERRSDYEAEIENQLEYERMLEALYQRYGGKQISVLGDSISTFYGVSNNPAYHSSLEGNPVHYGDSAHFNVQSMYHTYWGRFIRDVGMELCVPNAISASEVYTSMLKRASNLQNNAGVKPDLLLIYLGINDVMQKKPFGDLYAILTDTTDTRSDNEKIATWFDAVEAQADAAGDEIVAGTTYKSFEQAYALSLKKISENYPDTDVFCFTLAYNAYAGCPHATVDRYNVVIRALAEYFGCGLVDQARDGVITAENCRFYTGEYNGVNPYGVHPNAYGHQKIEELVVRSIYKEITK